MLAAAVYFVLVELHRPAVAPNFDVYIYFVPNKLHAVYSFWHGGKGLLWNPYQACGEPFFANPAMGLLYPPHLLFLVLDPNAAVHAVLIVNMVLGSIGMLLLARQLGLGWTAAVCAALAFELGDAMAQLTGWSPMHNGSWTWLPWALLFCERLLHAPSRGGVVGLTAALALGVLPGWVLISALTYQLILLRVGWELLTRRGERPWGPVGAVLAGLTLAPLLVAIQLVPAAELARESHRVSLDVADFLAYGGLQTDVRASIASRVPPVPFMASLLLLAAVAPLASADRRLATFYLAAGALYAVLALGPATPLFSLYVSLPPGPATLRYPNRLFFISGFSLVMLTALSVDGLIDRGERPRARWLFLLVAVALAAALYRHAPGGLRRAEMVSLAAVIAALFAAALRPGLRRPAGWIIVGAVVLNLVGVPLRYMGKLVPSADVLLRHAEIFSAIRSRMTPQDRVFIVSSVGSLLNLGLAQKTATIMRVPDVYDYEPLLGQRLADYYSTMWHGSPVRNVADITTRPTVMAGYRQRLFDLASIRYVITPPSSPFTGRGLDLRPVPGGSPELVVYSSDTSFPRARYVPRIEVIREPDVLLNRLAFGTDDLAQVAFVEATPPSGFTGETGPRPAGAARFSRDDPEHVVIDVDAPARGFLVLADQYSPGWRATVNGAPVLIVRTNYTFRLIEVPGGDSRVELRYRPASVAVGGAISAVALGVVAALFFRGRGATHGRA